MTEIRRLEKDDLVQFYKMHAVVYNLRRDFSKEENQKIDSLDHPASWAYGAFKGKKLLAGMLDIDFLMRFDGHSVKMSGIGGVGTLPEARKEGHIRRIFEKLQTESHENGFIFSCLTPFNHDFYRKFGYETAVPRINVSIKTKYFSKIKTEGEFIHILPGDDTSALSQVHSEYIKNINHGIHRDYWQDNRAWKRFTKDDPFASGIYLYLWKDENGTARSYIKYEDVFENGEHNMHVKELAFADRKGLYGALSIVTGLSAQFKKFRWAMPAYIDPLDFTGDAWNIEMKIDPKDMSRVVNVKKALELMRRPDSEGGYVIKVEDKNIAQNNGKYLVEFSPDETRVSETSREEDIKCDIRSLTQLVTGYRSIENALYSRQEGLSVFGNFETLKKVFTVRPQHITEYF